MNLVKLQNDLKILSDEQVAGQLQSGSVPAYLVIAELERRKRMRQQGVPTDEPQSTVADDVLQPPQAPQAPQMPQGGIAQLPVQSSPQGYSDGGIVSFAEGGPTSVGVLPALYKAIETIESRGDPKAVSPKGAVGRMQTLPSTLKDPGYGVRPARDDSDAERTRVGRDYARAMLRKYNGDLEQALMAYNWGPGNVDRWLRGDPISKADRRAGKKYPPADPARVPRETREYVPKVKNQLVKLGGEEALQAFERSQEAPPAPTPIAQAPTPAPAPQEMAAPALHPVADHYARREALQQAMGVNTPRAVAQARQQPLPPQQMPVTPPQAMPQPQVPPAPQIVQQGVTPAPVGQGGPLLPPSMSSAPPQAIPPAQQPQPSPQTLPEGIAALPGRAPHPVFDHYNKKDALQQTMGVSTPRAVAQTREAPRTPVDVGRQSLEFLADKGSKAMDMITLPSRDGAFNDALKEQYPNYAPGVPLSQAASDAIAGPRGAVDAPTPPAGGDMVGGAPPPKDNRNGAVGGLGGDVSGIGGLSALFNEANKVAGVGDFPEQTNKRRQSAADELAASMKDRERSNLNTSLMQAGLAMMAGESTNAFTNIGAGGIAGLTKYAEGKKDINDLRKEIMGLEIAAEDAANKNQMEKYNNAVKRRDALLGLWEVSQRVDAQKESTNMYRAGAIIQQLQGRKATLMDQKRKWAEDMQNPEMAQREIAAIDLELQNVDAQIKHYSNDAGIPGMGAPPASSRILSRRPAE